MEKLTFKTNIKCGGCIATVKPHLEAVPEITHWEVDTNNPDKIMTVETSLKAEEVIEVVKKAGYEALKA
ncbi:heavy-metal-associated domain-containing protein [Penaeicola halotolerans]|uniref:heavy-metal-associated domain-containing protein n=1 Tax=Penaeicola halotolerans TaxID=2793196 RepID=UPI001CF9004E|nr:cation transporter [Penaeicola halotolerans]